MSSSPQPSYPSSTLNQYTIAFEGSSIACILYGMYLVIVGMNMRLLQKKRYRILWTFSIVQFIITTLYMAVSLFAAPAQSLALFGIAGVNGPDALSPWFAVVVDAAFILNTWCSDAFLLYRCYVVCSGNLLALAVPVFLYVCMVAASLAWLIIGSTPGAVYSTYGVQVAGIACLACSATTNVCASLLISARLWMHRQAISQAVGSPQGSFYLGYMAMTLESALLYTVFVVILLIVFVINSPLENVFFPVVGNIQVIAPALIIYRIARGISFETDEYGTVTAATMRFASGAKPRAIVRGTHDISGGSGTVRVSSGDAIEHDSTSFIHEMKDKV